LAPDSSADRSAAGRAADRAGDRAEDLAAFLREETTGGQLLLGATALALLWANLSEESYRAVWDAHVALGPEWLQLDLSLADWAADGLLAVFFFVAGMEVKRELTVGELADRRSASLPLLAALGGMVVPRSWRSRCREAPPRGRGLGHSGRHRQRVRAGRTRARWLRPAALCHRASSLPTVRRCAPPAAA